MPREYRLQGGEVSPGPERSADHQEREEARPPQDNRGGYLHQEEGGWQGRAAAGVDNRQPRHSLHQEELWTCRQTRVVKFAHNYSGKKIYLREGKRISFFLLIQGQGLWVRGLASLHVCF